MALYRTMFHCWVRHDELWLSGTERELDPLVAIGLSLIYAGLLERVDVASDGAPMDLPEPGTPDYARAIAAANRAVVHAFRDYSGAHQGRR